MFLAPPSPRLAADRPFAGCGAHDPVLVAAVLDELEARGLVRGTLVVFCGDNGAALPHGKGSLYDPGCHVPFLVRWPGVVKAGSESRGLISGEDLAPTLLAAAGLPVPARMTGVSFLPLFKGESFTPRQHLFTERGPHGSASVNVDMKNSGYDLSRAVRSDRYKFIYNCTPSIVLCAGAALRLGWRMGTLRLKINTPCLPGNLTSGAVVAYVTVRG